MIYQEINIEKAAYNCIKKEYKISDSFRKDFASTSQSLGIWEAAKKYGMLVGYKAFIYRMKRSVSRIKRKLWK